MYCSCHRVECVFVVKSRKITFYFSYQRQRTQPLNVYHLGDIVLIVSLIANTIYWLLLKFVKIFNKNVLFIFNFYNSKILVWHKKDKAQNPSVWLKRLRRDVIHSHVEPAPGRARGKNSTHLAKSLNCSKGILILQLFYLITDLRLLQKTTPRV